MESGHNSVEKRSARKSGGAADAREQVAVFPAREAHGPRRHLLDFLRRSAPSFQQLRRTFLKEIGFPLPAITHDEPGLIKDIKTKSARGC